MRQRALTRLIAGRGWPAPHSMDCCNRPCWAHRSTTSWPVNAALATMHATISFMIIIASRTAFTHFYATSHQPGAQHAIAAFLSGYLNTETRAPFARLTQPVILVWGKQDLTTPMEKRIALARSERRRASEVFDYCRMMPEQEHPEKFNALVREAFLETAEPLSLAASEKP